METCHNFDTQQILTLLSKWAALGQMRPSLPIIAYIMNQMQLFVLGGCQLPENTLHNRVCILLRKALHVIGQKNKTTHIVIENVHTPWKHPYTLSHHFENLKRPYTWAVWTISWSHDPMWIFRQDSGNDTSHHDIILVYLDLNDTHFENIQPILKTSLHFSCHFHLENIPTLQAENIHILFSITIWVPGQKYKTG